jgi:hypothetical protein
MPLLTRQPLAIKSAALTPRFFFFDNQGLTGNRRQATRRWIRGAATKLSWKWTGSIPGMTNAKAAAVIPQAVESAVSPFVYAYARRNIRRNLYRIPLP